MSVGLKANVDGTSGAVQVNGNDVVTVNSAGNVGIGTSSAGNKLDIVSTGSSQIRVKDGVGATAYYDFGRDSTDGLFGFDGAQTTFVGYKWKINGAEKMRIDANGNVGIGTSSPGVKLDLVDYLPPLRIASSSTSGYGFMQFGQSATAANNWHFGSEGTGALQFFNGNWGSGIERMCITSAGNVGIGTSSPKGKLQVNGGDIVTDANRGLLTNLYYEGGWKYVDNGYGAVIAPDTSGTGILTIQQAPNNTGGAGAAATPVERMRIDSAGNVLINATAIGSYFDGKFNVAGRIHVKDNVGPLYLWNPDTTGNNPFVYFVTETAGTTRGSIYYNRGIGQIVYAATSDYRAKDIIGPVENTGATIDALKVYTGQMRGATMAYPMMVAHEAQEVVPFAVSGEKDAVNEDGTPKYQQMDHAILVPLLIAELQSVRARLAALEAK